MTGSGVRKSTTDMIAPARKARRDRNVERLPRQRRATKWAHRPQSATQLQHSNRKSKVQLRGLFAGFVARILSAHVAARFDETSCFSRRESSNIFENTSRCEILQWLASE